MTFKFYLWIFYLDFLAKFFHRGTLACKFSQILIRHILSLVTAWQGTELRLLDHLYLRLLWRNSKFYELWSGCKSLGRGLSFFWPAQEFQLELLGA